MSNLSQDLDFFDQSIFDPLVQIENKLMSNFSFQSKQLEKEEWEREKDSETEGETEEENICQEKRTSELGKEESEKRDESQDSVETRPCSDEESTEGKTVDSWDLPLGPIPWEDNDKPMERLLSYADLTLTDAEENGLLTDRIIAACSSYLTESPGNKCHIVAKVSLNNKNLNDIRILGYHRFLQYVDLSWNNLTDLTPLGCLPYLMYLDVSHNLMEEVLRFRPPLNLTYVNYSYNEVWQIDDLTDFWSLSYLDLSHNKISKIQGLHDLRYLRHLDLSHNKIERFENLNYLKITDLNLEYNLISKFEMELELGMRTLPHLSNVYLNNNLITNMAFLQGVYTLKKLELQSNNISDLLELSNLKLLKNLRCLDISGNPVSELKPYRNLLLNLLPELKFLDQTDIDISERIAACKKMRFDVQLEAARNHARMILLEQLNDTSLDLDVLPVDQGPYPFVILVGPSASSKKFIVNLLGEKYPDKLVISGIVNSDNTKKAFKLLPLNGGGLCNLLCPTGKTSSSPVFSYEDRKVIYIGKLHTTRKVLDPEKNVLVHMSKDVFDESIKEGKFLCVSENLGELYGFSREELGKAVKEHKLCLTAMDMVAALTVHSYGLQPFLVLTIPESKEEHTERLKKTYGPVLSVLGATYIAQRQFMDSHSSNIRRVEIILNDIINEVMQQVTNTMNILPEDFECFSDTEGLKSVLDEKSSKSDFISTSDKQRDSSEINLSVDFASYETKTNRFPCTASKCGYQTSRLCKECKAAGSFASSAKESKRWASSETSMSPQIGETSYSATEPLLIKPSLSPSEENSYGEGGPFVNWSMPFIDWSEVNLSSLQLEEAAEILCEKYIENVMSTREIYQNLHLENPGLFSLSIFSDDTNKAVKEITKLLKEVWRTTPKREAPFDVENDLVYQAFASRKLEKLKEMLRNDFLSADGDGTFKGLNNAASVNSPMSVCAEMHLKGYGDFAENL